MPVAPAPLSRAQSVNSQAADPAGTSWAATGEATAGHVPEDVCYGPVHSRRLGRSLGVSLSPANVWACAWKCPYCQQGHLPRDPTACVPEADIVRAVHQGLQRHAGHIDTLCIAGGGEPTDHPAFDRLTIELSRMAHRVGVPIVLLTNGDGLRRTAIRTTIDRFDRIFVKWDPGVIGGSWPARSEQDAHERRLALHDIPGIRIQAMLYHDARGGNALAVHRQAWLEDMRVIAPAEIHLTTIERIPRSPQLRPVDAMQLAMWRRSSKRALGCQVSIFPARLQSESESEV